MDAAEIARLREEHEEGLRLGDPYAPTILSLLDALEQARKERDEARKSYDDVLTRWAELLKNRNDHSRLRAVAEIERDQAQKDAKDARALLGECLPKVLPALRARIEAMLEQKP